MKKVEKWEERKKGRVSDLDQVWEKIVEADYDWLEEKRGLEVSKTDLCVQRPTYSIT